MKANVLQYERSRRLLRRRTESAGGNDSSVGRQTQESGPEVSSHFAGPGRGAIYLQSLAPLSLRATRRPRYEVLLRMRDGDGLELPPGQFLASAERAGFGVQIDRWVLNQVLQILDNQDRRLASRQAVFSVKLSNGSLLDDAVLGDLEQLAQHGAGRLCLEFDAAVLLSIEAEVQRFTGQLRRLGVGFGFDRFGPRMLAITHALTELRPDYIKLPEQWYGARACSGHGGAATTQALARELKVDTVITKIDDISQLIPLAKAGLDYAQGNAVSAPRPFAATKPRFEMRAYG